MPRQQMRPHCLSAHQAKLDAILNHEVMLVEELAGNAYFIIMNFATSFEDYV